jgi:hypothetical protein
VRKRLVPFIAAAQKHISVLTLCAHNGSRLIVNCLIANIILAVPLIQRMGARV